jgi:hypothetical protein
MVESAGGQNLPVSMEVVLKEMRRNPDDAGILEKACASLCDLGNKGTFPQGVLTRAIKAVRMAMNRFPENGNLQESSLLFMITIYSSDPNTAAAVANEGCIPAVLKAMRSHASRYVMQEFACQVLYQASYGMEPRYVHVLWKERALDTVFETLHARLQAPQGEADPRSNLLFHQMVAYKMVTAMFAAAPECRRGDDSNALVLPGLKVLLYSMARHSQLPDSVLQRLARHVQFCDPIPLAMNAIFASMTMKLQNADILGVDGIKAVMDCMRAHENNFEVQLAGSMTLPLMVTGSPERQRFADKLGCIEYVHHRVMRAYKSHAESQHFGSKFIAAMVHHAGDDERRLKIAEQGIIGTLAAALRRHVSDQRVCKYACKALACLSRVQSARHKYMMMTERACDAILSALQLHKNNESLLLFGCRAILETLTHYRYTPPKSAEEYSELVQIKRKADPIILGILSDHVTSPHFAIVCSDIFSCMNNSEFAYDPELARRVGISLFVRGLNAHTDKCALMRLCRALSVFSRTYPRECRDAGAMEALLAMVDKVKEDPLIVCSARQALGSMTDGHAENSAYLNKIMSNKQAKILQHSQSAHPALLANSQSYPQYFTASEIEQVELRLQTLTEEDTAAQKIFHREKEKKAESCNACGKTAGDLGLARMLRCSACTLRPCYCSAECQRACWGAHKQECKANRVQKS